METGELHFEDGKAFMRFAKQMEDAYPDQCTDEMGNTCSLVQGRALDIAEKVDHKEITEEEAVELAKKSGENLAVDCKYGLSKSGKCGYGVLCVLGVWE